MRRRRHRYTLLAIAAALLAAAPLTLAAATASAATLPPGAHPDIIGAGHTFNFTDADDDPFGWQYATAYDLIIDSSLNEGYSNFKASGSIGDGYQTLTDTADGVCAAYFNSGTIDGHSYTDVINEHACTAGGTTPNYVEWQFTRLADGDWIVQNLWTNQNDALCAGGYEKVVSDDVNLPGPGLKMECPLDGTGVYDTDQEWNVVPS